MATPLQTLRGGRYTPGKRLEVPDRLRQVINEIAQQEGVDPELLATVVRQETGGGKNPFDPRSAGGAGDYGLAQVTLPVAKAYLKNPNLTPENLYDEVTNLTAAARYLKDISTQYDDPKQIFTTYNAGETRMRKAVKAAQANGTTWEIELAKINRDNVKYGNEAIALYQGAPPTAVAQAPPTRERAPGFPAGITTPPQRRRDVGPVPEMTATGPQPVPQSATALQGQPTPAPGPTLARQPAPQEGFGASVPGPGVPEPTLGAPTATALLPQGGPAAPGPAQQPGAPPALPRTARVVPATPEEIALGLDSPNLGLAPQPGAPMPFQPRVAGAAPPAIPPASLPPPVEAPTARFTRGGPGPGGPGRMDIPATTEPAQSGMRLTITSPRVPEILPDIPEDYPIPGPTPPPTRTPAEAAAVLPVLPYQAYATPPIGLGGAKPPGIGPPPAPIIGGLRTPPVPMDDVTGGTLPPDAGAFVPGLMETPGVVPRAQIPGAPPLSLGSVPPSITTPGLPPPPSVGPSGLPLPSSNTLEELTDEELLDLYEFLGQQGAFSDMTPRTPAWSPSLPAGRPRSFQEESLYWGREGGV